MRRNLSSILSATEERKEDENKKKITGTLRQEDFKFKDNLGHIAILSLSSPPPTPILCFSHYFQTLVASRCASDKIHPSPLISSTSDILAFFPFFKWKAPHLRDLELCIPFAGFFLCPVLSLRSLPPPRIHTGSSQSSRGTTPCWFSQGYHKVHLLTRLSCFAILHI